MRRRKSRLLPGRALLLVLAFFAGTTLAALPKSGWSSNEVLMAKDLTDNFQDLDSRLQALEKDMAPAGTIVAFGGATAPAGWLICDGQVLNKTNYPALYGAIGEQWGDGGDASGPQFNIPDLRGAFLRGADPQNKTSRDPDAPRAVGGSMQPDLLKSHDHVLNDPGHIHQFTGVGNGPYGPASVLADEWANYSNQYTALATTGVTMEKTGGAETRPKNFAVTFVIKM